MDNPGELSYDELEGQWQRMLHKFSAKYVIPGYDREDVLQELRMTLVRAQELYNPDKGTKFITYLYGAFDSKCKQLYRDVQGRQKHVPANMMNVGLDDNHHRATKDDYENVDILTGLSPSAVRMSILILEGKAKRKDWLAAGMTKDEVRMAKKELALALEEGRK